VPYLRNASSNEIHHRVRDERCNADDMEESNKNWMSFDDLLRLIQLQGDLNFCKWCWKDEEGDAGTGL